MKKQYKYLLWDIDDTLIDFKKSEKVALQMCFQEFGVVLTDQDVKVYSDINHRYWEQLAQGKIEKATLLERRFEDFVQVLSVEDIDCGALNQLYQVKLGDHAVMMENAYEICSQLKQTKQQYALTNGTAVAQHKKLHNTGLGRLFDGIFISDEVGYEKPDVRIFQAVFDSIENFDPEQALMIGDSLLSDMAGANHAGIDCCWFNPHGKVNETPAIQIDYQIKTLKQILEIVL